MIKHILLYRFKPGIDRIDEHLAVIAGFRNSTEGLIDLSCGRNINSTSLMGFTHGFVMTFDSQEALDNYNKSEDHNALVALFKNDIEDKLVIDLEDSQWNESGGI